MANTEKLRLEQRQRQVTQISLWVGIWFGLVWFETYMLYKLVRVGETGKEDAGERMEAEVVHQGERKRCLQIQRWVLGSTRERIMGRLSGHLWPRRFRTANRVKYKLVTLILK